MRAVEENGEKQERKERKERENKIFFDQFIEIRSEVVKRKT